MKSCIQKTKDKTCHKDVSRKYKSLPSLPLLLGNPRLVQVVLGMAVWCPCFVWNVPGGTASERDRLTLSCPEPILDELDVHAVEV